VKGVVFKRIKKRARVFNVVIIKALGISIIIHAAGGDIGLDIGLLSVNEAARIRRNIAFPLGALISMRRRLVFFAANGQIRYS